MYLEDRGGAWKLPVLLPIVMVVLDGASDRPGPDKTPLEMTKTPHLDSFARIGNLGLLYTVGKGVAPESDAGVFGESLRLSGRMLTLTMETWP